MILEKKSKDIPIPPINPEFSIFCQTKMKNGESILADMQERYPDFIPELDEDFIKEFLCYVESEGPDFTELLEVFLINNTESLISWDAIALLFSKMPYSLYHIYIALEFGGNYAFSKFYDECGFYFMIKYSSEPEFKLVISQILQLTIAKITDVGSCTQCPYTLDELLSEETEIVYEDLKYEDLIVNLLESDDEEIISNTIKAFHIGFENNVMTRVTFGQIFMHYFDDFIANPAYSEETLTAFSFGINGIPEYLIDRDHILEISESLLSTDDNILVESGIKLPLQLLDLKRKKIPDPSEPPLSIFQDSDVIRLIFQIAQNGTYKMKVLSFQAIKEFIEVSYQNDEIGLFLEYGIIELLNDTFSDEKGDTVVDKELILICIEILSDIQKKIPSQDFKQIFTKMFDLFNYLYSLQFNEDDEIFKKAKQAFESLSPIYGLYLYDEGLLAEEDGNGEEDEEEEGN